jgi:hypothetical protein
MAIAADFTITYSGTKTVEHTSGTTVYTVLEFFQWLAAEFAASDQMDDDYAFVSDTPTVFRWVNDWAFGAPTTDYKFLSGGAIESSDAADLWSNIYHIGSLEEGSQIYIIQDSVEITPWWSTGSIDILLNVRTSSALIDGGNVLCMVRETDYTYDHNIVDLSGGGRNPVGLNNAPDINYGRLADTGDIYIEVADSTGFTAGQYVLGDTSGATARINYVDSVNDYLYIVMNFDGTGPFEAAETIDEGASRGATGGASSTQVGAEIDVINAYGSGLTISYAGPYSKDLNNGNNATDYDTTVVATGETVLQVYQSLKYLTKRGSVVAVDGDDGQEYLSALDPTYTAVKSAPFGTFAGGTFFGARGIWLEGTATAAYSLFNSANAQQNPPDYQNVTVSHTTLSGCQILVAEISAGDFVKDSYTVLSVTANSLTTTASMDINKTPQSGTFRMGASSHVSGTHDDLVYTYGSFSGAVFSSVTPDPTAGGDEAGDLYVPLMDLLADETSELSANVIYDGAFTVRTVVRKYGFKPYTADTTFGANGLTFSPILTDDPQAT